MIEISKYHILLVDDNPIATHECIKVLAEELKLDSCQEYNGFYKRWTSKTNSKTILCHYKPTTPKTCDDFLTEISTIITEEEINVLWFDKGYYDTVEEAGQVLANSKLGDAVDLLPEIFQMERSYGFQQIVVYSFNPALTEKDIKACEVTIRQARGENDRDVFFLELSTIYVWFNEDERVTNGTEMDNKRRTILGTVKGFEKYGNLSGYVLSDLYNYLTGYLQPSFRTNSILSLPNYSSLRFIKRINDRLSLPNGFRIATMTFSLNIEGVESFPD